MSNENQYSFNELAGYIESLPADYPVQAIDAIKSLALQYQGGKRLINSSSVDCVDKIKGLAGNYRQEKLSGLNSRALSILTPEQVRIYIYGCNKDAKIEAIKSGVVTFREIPLARIPRLPPSYGFKGGAARLALAAILGKDVKNRKPRDWDIFRLGTEPLASDDELARRYMPDDYHHGHGIELLSDIRTYLHSRDLTINQVAIIDGTVICTYAAIEDTANGILRPTEYVRAADDSVDAKITMKMIRMMAEARLEGNNLTLAESSHNVTVTPFEIALHLERILQRGSRAAKYYLEFCISLGYLKAEDGKAPIGDVIARLKSLLRRNGPANLRRLRGDQMRKITA